MRHPFAPLSGAACSIRAVVPVRPLLLLALVLCFAVSGCRHSESNSSEAQKGSSPEQPGARVVDSSEKLPPGMSMFDLRAHPNATIIHPVDIKTLTESERRFGIAPKRGPGVDYQPGTILMEQGDKAIRAIASDGMTWTFDANAPHVNEFQMGKIVFATGRAVGRIIWMKRDGDDVKVILGPVQLGEVIRKGEFAMSSPIDLNNVLVITAPDMPEPLEVAQKEKTSAFRNPWAGWNKTIVVSRVSKKGKWRPVSMSRTFPDGRQMSYMRVGRRWSAEEPARAVLSRTRAGFGGNTPRLQRAGWNGQMMMPGAPGPALQGYRPIPDYPVPSSLNLPILQIPKSDMSAQPFADNGSIGVKYSYEKNGVSFVATGALVLENARANFFMKFGGGKVPISAGLELAGAVGVRLHLKAHTDNDFHVNVQKKIWLPTEISIPLGGVIPFSLTFDQALALNTGFSAKNSILNAEGDYGFDGGIKAGLFANQWADSKPTVVRKNVDIGETTQGISVGINSLVMSAELRAMVGLGNQLFTTGVYATLVFTGTMLRAPDIALPCRQGTIEVALYTGVGYAIAPFIADAINYMLSFVTDVRIDPTGSLLKGPTTSIMHGITKVPGGCS